MKILFLLWFPFHHSFPSGSGIVGFHGYLGGGWVGDTSSLGLVAPGVCYPAMILTSLHQHPGNTLCSHSVLEPLFPRICVFLFCGLIPYFGRALPSGTFWEGVGRGKFWNTCWPEKGFILLSYLIDSVARQRILGWWRVPSKLWRRFSHSLLPFGVVEKSSVILS